MRTTAHRVHDADLCERIRKLEERVRELEARPYHYNHYPYWTYTPWTANTPNTITIDNQTYTTPAYYSSSHQV